VDLVRTSERTSFKHCRWAWDLSYNRQLRQRRDSPPLRFGTLAHLALADYYIKGKKRGEHPARSFEKYYEQDVREAGEFAVYDSDGYEDVAKSEKWINALEMGVELLEDYVDFYNNDEDWEVLATEQAFKTPVRHPVTGRVLFYYVGTLDLVMRQISTKRIWIWDHKTAAQIDNTALGLNEQFGSYWTFGVDWLREKNILKSKVIDDLSGLMVNYLRRSRRDSRPMNAEGQYLNQDKTVSKRQPSPRFQREATWRTEHDRDEVRRRALNDWREMNMVRDGKISCSKSPSPFHCKTCGWLDVCELHETGSDWLTMLTATTEEWNPYDAHEIADAEKR
jgi:PD-(D/E)XK nuclease superfamily